ncbi:hypothetical protein [Pseudanabaena sp. PCC 6802]|uniref:hypothetical protein n=1 Tax=Pseudanabaena sp. PCC 6802 TaxID=118173 RepID=UPI00034ACD61|nr:hypothetical protein [Pseudanabaena sp. PCC 6802]
MPKAINRVLGESQEKAFTNVERNAICPKRNAIVKSRVMLADEKPARATAEQIASAAQKQ